jgi:hypothetical protein
LISSKEQNGRWLGRSSRVAGALCALAALIVLAAAAPRASAAFGEFEPLAESPAALTSVGSDPATGVIYAQENEGTKFFSYDPRTNTWTELAEAPVNSGNNGGATVLGGKVYTDYTSNSKVLGVYDIAANTWSTIPNPLEEGTGAITTYADELYMVVEHKFVKYNPGTEVTTPLAEPPAFTGLKLCTSGPGFEPWGGLHPYNGKLYGDQGNGCGGFAVYDPTSNTWAELPETAEENEEGPVLGSAIDPVSGTYFTYGNYGGNELFTYDIASETWSTKTLPFQVEDGGMAYVSLAGLQGIYIVEGELGGGFGRIRTPEPAPEIHEPPPTPTTTPPTPTTKPTQTPPPPMCVVPKMRALNLAQVKAALAAANCALGSVAHHYSALPVGALMQQDRHEGTILPVGSKVNIWLSRGRHHQASKHKKH